MHGHFNVLYTYHVRQTGSGIWYVRRHELRVVTRRTHSGEPPYWCCTPSLLVAEQPLCVQERRAAGHCRLQQTAAGQKQPPAGQVQVAALSATPPDDS